MMTWTERSFDLRLSDDRQLLSRSEDGYNLRPFSASIKRIMDTR